MSSSPAHIAFTLDFSPLTTGSTPAPPAPSASPASPLPTWALSSGSAVSPASASDVDPTVSLLSGAEKTSVFEQISNLVAEAYVQIHRNLPPVSPSLDIVSRTSFEILTDPASYFWQRASYDTNRITLLLVPNVAKIKASLKLPFQQYLAQHGRFPWYLRLWFAVNRVLGLPGPRAVALKALFEQRFDEFSAETVRCLMAGWNDLFFDTYSGSLNRMSPVYFSASSHSLLSFSFHINDREVVFNYA